MSPKPLRREESTIVATMRPIENPRSSQLHSSPIQLRAEKRIGNPPCSKSLRGLTGAVSHIERWNSNRTARTELAMPPLGGTLSTGTGGTDAMARIARSRRKMHLSPGLCPMRYCPKPRSSRQHSGKACRRHRLRGKRARRHDFLAI